MFVLAGGSSCSELKTTWTGFIGWISQALWFIFNNWKQRAARPPRDRSWRVSFLPSSSFSYFFFCKRDFAFLPFHEFSLLSYNSLFHLYLACDVTSFVPWVSVSQMSRSEQSSGFIRWSLLAEVGMGTEAAGPALSRTEGGATSLGRTQWLNVRAVSFAHFFIWCIHLSRVGTQKSFTYES